MMPVSTTTLILFFSIAVLLAFSLPLLAHAHHITSRQLLQKRRYVILGAFVAAALLAPPHVLSQLSLALPLMVLYEASILSVRLVEKP
jgi:sec-independent protein translocase protein TatC